MIGIELDNYDVRINPKKDTSGKIIGGLSLVDILRQNQAIIIKANKGEIKEKPALGVGIDGMLLDYDPSAWRLQIRENLELDGQNVNDIKITKNNIVIDANY